jgi:type II secretory pathway pseudopilin PulG
MRRQLRPAFTLFQLLVIFAILLILFALLLPAIMEARAKAERAKAFNNLKQLGLALINYADTYNGILPPGVDDNHFSAANRLLPFIEQANLYNKIDFKKSIDDKANAEARKVKIKVFLSKGDPIESVKDEWGATNYLFNDKVFFRNSKTPFPAAFTDGTSNTIVVGETLKGDGQTKATDVKRQYVLLKKEDLKGTGPNTGVKYFKDDKNIAGDRCGSWMDGRFLQGTFNARLLPNDERPDVSCGGISGVSALRSFDKFVLVGLGDGSARTVKNTISRPTWEHAIDPQDGFPLGPDW